MVGINDKWDYAIHFQPAESKRFWSDRLENKEKNVLIIIGLGWDPRMSIFVDSVKSFGGQGDRDIHLVYFRPYKGFKSPYQKYIDKNYQLISDVCDKWGNITNISVDTRNIGNYYTGDKEIGKIYKDFDLDKYDDVVVDISSLPKSLYFTLLNILVHKALKFYYDLNVFCVACQHSGLDSKILESIDDTRFLSGFKGYFGRVGLDNIPRIWVPLLENNQLESLSKLMEVAEPRDIYPILPFPSKNPKQDDEILMEYSNIFADEWSFNLMNFIYATEDEPLDVYQRIIRLYHQQKEALEPLGGISMVISPLSSKLSSLGAFMAAFEKRFTVAHTIGRHTPPENMDDNYWNDEFLKIYKENLHTVWLTGEPYEL